jgi:hypothetical protein
MLFLRADHHLARAIKDNEARAAGSLVDGADVTGHTVSLNLPGFALGLKQFAAARRGDIAGVSIQRAQECIADHHPGAFGGCIWPG